MLSNAHPTLLEPILSENNINKYFDEIVISGIERTIKPEPEIFNIILNRLDIKPDEAVFIDDRMENIEAARKLKIYSILYKDVKKLRIDLKQVLT